ncbi:MAG: class I SAM-dependent methyltransferase [Alphaproteobacteria bacterium]|nr:class I SAM-dependent methyltransferase [Alphaproteobacteria bacterium]
MRLSDLRDFPQYFARRNVMRHKELAELIASNSPSTGANYFDYWLLYSHIRKTGAKEVLELGPGLTTLVIAQALYENGGGRVTAMEDLPQYFEALHKIIPEHLRPFIDAHLSPSHQVHYGPFRGKAYQSIPERDYDFVWVDGPNYDRETEYDADILQIIAKRDKPLTAFVDSRVGSCFIYSLVFGKKFRYDYIRRIGKLTASKRDMKTYKQIFTRMKWRGTIYGLFRI